MMRITFAETAFTRRPVFGRERTIACVAACLTVVALPGCGGSDGPRRYRVTGTVTYDGRPVAAGRVIFEPDREQGNSGPAGYAAIQDGRYTTDPGRGFVGGPHKVRVIALSGIAEGEELPEGRMLCPEFHVVNDFPKGNASFDIVVPGTHQWPQTNPAVPGSG